METEDKVDVKNLHKNRVHRILAHSYSVQFILFLVGVCLDLIFQIKIPSSPIVMPIGIIILILGSLLIVWAQKTSQDLKIENMTKETFFHGPYRYTRSPTHFGLFFLTLGFGMMVNAPFVILSTIISFIISKSIFLNKQEMVLAEKYGAPYLEYKKMVRF